MKQASVQFTHRHHCGNKLKLNVSVSLWLLLFFFLRGLNHGLLIACKLRVCMGHLHRKLKLCSRDRGDRTRFQASLFQLLRTLPASDLHTTPLIPVNFFACTWRPSLTCKRSTIVAIVSHLVGLPIRASACPTPSAHASH